MHFARNGDKTDEIPLRRLIGSAVVVDVSRAARADRDHQVTRADLAAHERRHGRIERGAIVLLRTGWGRFWPDRERYPGTAELGEQAVPKLHFPGLHPDAANVPMFENVANLQRMPAEGSLVIALPMKIDGGSGGPLRLMAIVPPRR